MSHADTAARCATARAEYSAKRRKRGKSRVRRNTHDLDSPKAQIHAPLGDGETLESSQLIIKALIETLELAQAQTAAMVRYGQGCITRVGLMALKTLLKVKYGFDHWSGTNDLANSDIAKWGGFSKRQWQRVKPQMVKLGIFSAVHRSIKTGFEGDESDLQISDLYSFSPDRLVPWLKELFDKVLAEMVAKDAADEKRDGVPRKRTPLVKRDRPHRRIPALLNPFGWQRAVAAQARPVITHADREAEALAFASKLAQSGWSAVPG